MSNDPPNESLRLNTAIAPLPPNEKEWLASLRLAAIVEFSDDAIIGKDLNSIITSWNPAAERMFGYAATEIIGKPITLLFPPDRIQEENEILNTAS